MGRATQGVRLIKLRGEDEISSVAKVVMEDKDDPYIFARNLYLQNIMRDADQVREPDSPGLPILAE